MVQSPTFHKKQNITDQVHQFIGHLLSASSQRCFKRTPVKRPCFFLPDGTAGCIFSHFVDSFLSLDALFLCVRRFLVALTGFFRRQDIIDVRCEAGFCLRMVFFFCQQRHGGRGWGIFRQKRLGWETREAANSQAARSNFSWGF